MNKEAEINKELIKVLKDKIQLLEEQKVNSQEIINAQKEQLILSGVVKSLPNKERLCNCFSNKQKIDCGFECYNK